ncbi:MAG: hypothetical protein ACTSU7_00615 [Candidatus Heimdallarchaeaceae archaeon]
MKSLKLVLATEHSNNIVVVDDNNFLVASIKSYNTKERVSKTHGHRKVLRVGTDSKTTTIQIQH